MLHPEKLPSYLDNAQRKDLIPVALSGYFATLAVLKRRKRSDAVRALQEASVIVIAERTWVDAIRTALAHMRTVLRELPEIQLPNLVGVGNSIWLAYGGGLIACRGGAEEPNALRIGTLLAPKVKTSISMYARAGKDAHEIVDVYGTVGESIWAALALNYIRANPGRLEEVSRTARLRGLATRFAKQSGVGSPCPRLFTLDLQEDLLMATADRLIRGHHAKLRVAVVGGDDRVLRQEWPDTIEVKAFTGTDQDVRRLTDALASGKIDRVIILSRWISHSQFKSLKAQKVPVDIWPHGIPRLAKELETVLHVNEKPAAAGVEAPSPAPRPEVDSATWDEALREIIALDPKYRWTVAELIEMLGIDNDEALSEYQSARAAILDLVELGELEAGVGGYTVPQPPPPPPPPAPAPVRGMPAPRVGKVTDAVLVTWDEGGEGQWRGCTREEATRLVAKLRDKADEDSVNVWARLKVRVKVEFEA